MGNFARSFADSFSKSFEGARYRSVPYELSKYKEKLQLDIDNNAANIVSELHDAESGEAANRQEGIKITQDINQVTKVEPKVRKTLVKAKSERMKQQGINVLKPAEDYIASLGGEEGAIAMQVINEEVATNDQMNGDFMKEFLTNPVVFEETVTKISQQTQARLDTKAAVEAGEGGSAAQAKINAKTKKFQTEAKVLRNKVNAIDKKIATRNKLLQNPSVARSSVATKALNSEISVLEGKRDNLLKDARALEKTDTTSEMDALKDERELGQQIDKEGRDEKRQIAKEGRDEAKQKRLGK